MKRSAFLAVFLSLLFAFVGCHVNNSTNALASGNYYAVGDYEELMTPYLYLDTEDNTFAFGPGAVVSFAIHGSFEVKDEKLVAASQSATFVFEIQDEKTLVLQGNGYEYFTLPDNTEFVYGEEIR